MIRASKLRRLNGNQRHTDLHFFQFNKGIYPECGTKPKGAKVGCGRSVTICDSCVRSAILGNIVYGYVGKVAGFTREDLDRASAIKKKYGMTVDPYDEEAYEFGYDLLFGCGSSRYFICYYWNASLAKYPGALKEGNKSGGHNDLSTCKPCSHKKKETRHGGGEEPRW